MSNFDYTTNARSGMFRHLADASQGDLAIIDWLAKETPVPDYNPMLRRDLNMARYCIHGGAQSLHDLCEAYSLSDNSVRADMYNARKSMKKFALAIHEIAELADPDASVELEVIDDLSVLTVFGSTRRPYKYKPGDYTPLGNEGLNE